VCRCGRAPLAGIAAHRRPTDLGLLEDGVLPPRLDSNGHRLPQGTRREEFRRKRLLRRRHRGRRGLHQGRPREVRRRGLPLDDGDILNDEQQAAFEAWFRSGGGFVGIHAAADTEHTWPWYGNLVGAWFKTHPSPQKATVVVEDKTHASTSMLPERWERFDEWYVYKANPRTKKDAPVHVLATLDETTYDTGGNPMGDHPIAWCHEFDGGRAWYTGGGHTQESYAEPLFRQHLSAGIEWALSGKGARRHPQPVRTPKLDGP
jgi:type 1 glutamine amidotransferase